MVMALIMTAVLSSLVWLLASPLAKLFGLGGLALEYCTHHLRAIALVNCILSMYVPLFGVCQGSNHSIVPTVVAIVVLGVRVLVTYLFRYSDIFGHTIIWWNGLFGFGLGFMICWGYYLSGRWRSKATLVTKSA